MGGPENGADKWQNAPLTLLPGNFFLDYARIGLVTLSEELIRQAFALSRARGAGLLSLLGEFDVWHGDLTEMRGDSLTADKAATRDEPKAPISNDLADILLIARAIEVLDDSCRMALSNVYELNKGADSSDQERLTACKRRLAEISSEIESHASGPAIPDWIAEREHAALAAYHGRGRR